MPSPFEFIVVLDFEATCSLGPPPAPQEIIEFPSVLLSLADRSVVGEFTAFVRPLHNPQLTDFCRELTGIEQSEVDAAEPFTEVFAAHQAWLAHHGLEKFLFVTAGDWDLATMLPAQCATAGLPVPPGYRQWCNVKHPFAATFRKAKSSGMLGMLKSLELEPWGRHHRGIDDSRNIARIVLALLDREATLDVTATLTSSQYPELPLTLMLRDEPHAVVLRRRALASLLGLASAQLHAKIVAVHGPSGAPLTDADLQELTPHTILTAVPR